MLICKAFDVEVFPNMFSVIFIDLHDYLDKFKDCAGVSLNKKLTVDEIKRRLDSVKCDKFYITDTDDNQLLELVAYIRNMEAHFDIKTNKEGLTFKEPVRTDLYGFNNKGYDDFIIKGFLMKFDRFNNSKELCKYLYDLSKRIIELQSSNEFVKDPEIELLKGFKLPYTTVDVQRIYGLHSAGVNVDKDSGERIKYGKSLKQTSINLQWYELLDFTLPPIDDEEVNAYWSKVSAYKGFNAEQLNTLIHNDFDRYILPKYIEPMMHYNKNDVFIVCEMVRQKPDEVKLRYSITHAFGIDVLCSARANIADKLTVKFYSDMSGLRPDQFKKGRTERHKLSFNKIIFPHIKFKTKQLQDFLEDIKKVSIYHTNSSEFQRTINFYGTTYTIATGGIHSVDTPHIYVSDDKYVYRHHDYTSYYPSIMISYGLYPAHLNKNAFIKMLSYLKDTRVKCKHTPDSEGYVIDNVPNKIAAEALKIVINSIYGKLGSELFFLYDRFAQMQVTINGQLMTMTLVEELELNGIHVVSANTDGIVIKLPRDKESVYKEITDRWNEFNKMGADYEDYVKLITRDVNNYFDIQETKKGTEYEFKGALDPYQYLKDLKKGYDMPVVAQAVFEYFVHNTPVADYLHNCTNILDFCKTQNVGKQFDVVYQKIENGKVVDVKSQRHVRFYVSNKGVVIQKEDKVTGKRSRLASGKPVKILNTLDDVSIENRNIDYSYYIEECYKIIDPIKLGISPTQKPNAKLGTASGKVLIKKYSRSYNTLFNDEDFE